MSNPIDDFTADFSDEDGNTLLASSRETFFDALKRTSPEIDSANELDAVDKIRLAFDASTLDFQGGERSNGFPEYPGFTVLELLGQGGFGPVYRVRDEALEREVALKVVSRARELAWTSPDEFLHEARALAKVSHDNVVTIHSVLDDGGRIALVMELIDGESLDAIVTERGPLGDGEAAQVGRDIARALAAVHASGIVHRDVKPANILKRKGGGYVLTDFGLGIFLSRDASAQSEDVISGTPLLMSPEQVTGGTVDQRSDVYSLGVVLYNAVTDAFPYPSDGVDGVAKLFEHIRSGTKVSLVDRRPDLPSSLTDVVERAMALDPGGRFQTVGEMERALVEVVSPSSLRNHRGARPFVIGAAAAAAVLFVGFMFFLLDRPSAELGVERAAFVSLSTTRDLATGDAVRVGEEFRMEFLAGDDVHVYVLNADTTGKVTRLSPSVGSVVTNPFPAGRVHWLPRVRSRKGDAVHESWRVDTKGGGSETLFVVASRNPWGAFESVTKGSQLAPSQEVSSATLRQQTRAFGLAPAKTDRRETARALMEELVERLGEDSEDVAKLRQELWARKIERVNP